MSETQNTKEREVKQETPPVNWKRLLNYHSVVKQIPFFLFLTALAVLYIYNGHYADKTIRDINKTAKDVKELQYEYKTVKSEVMFRSQQSELAKAVEPLGLKEITVTPMMLKDSLAN
jgi:predicted membrane protein